MRCHHASAFPLHRSWLSADLNHTLLQVLPVLAFGAVYLALILIPGPIRGVLPAPLQQVGGTYSISHIKGLAQAGLVKPCLECRARLPGASGAR